MATQFDKLMQPRFKRLHEAAKVVAEDINQKAKDNSRRGEGFKPDRYDNDYSTASRDKDGLVITTTATSYAKRRLQQGLSIQNVVLRAKKNRKDRAKVKRKNNGALIYYPTDGHIFKYHHDGIKYKNGKFRMRSIFPKEATSVPADTNQLALEQAGKVLRG